MHRLAILRWAIFSTSLFAAKVGAIVPASQEQLVCSASSMFLGEVVKASSRDCRLKTGTTDCEPKDIVDLTVQIVKDLHGSQDHFHPTDIAEVATSVRNMAPIIIAGRVFNYDDDGTLEAGRGGSTLTDADARRAFEGKRYYFGIWPGTTGLRYWTKMWKRKGPASAMWEHICPRSPWRPKQTVGNPPRPAAPAGA